MVSGWLRFFWYHVFLSEKKEDEDSYENGLRDFKGKAGMETMFLGESPAQER